jgi:hypothetical protein
MTEIATEKKLTTQQRKAIETLFTTGSVSAAALAAGVNRATIYKWRNNDETFAEAIQEAEADAVAGLARSLAGLGESAAAALFDALQPGEKMSTRLRAAEIVTDRLLKLRELVTLEARIQALEAGNAK